jgi:hypothetical protein
MYYNQKEFSTPQDARDYLSANNYLLTPKAFLVSLPKGLTKKLGFTESCPDMLEDRALKNAFLMHAGFYKKEWGTIERDTLAFVGKQLEINGDTMKEGESRRNGIAMEIADKVVETLQCVQGDYCEYAYLEPKKGFYTIAYRKAGKEKPLGKHFGCTSYMLCDFFGDPNPVSTETIDLKGWFFKDDEPIAIKNDESTGLVFTVWNDKDYAMLGPKQNFFIAVHLRYEPYKEAISKEYVTPRIYLHETAQEYDLIKNGDYSFIDAVEAELPAIKEYLMNTIRKNWQMQDIEEPYPQRVYSLGISPDGVNHIARLKIQLLGISAGDENPVCARVYINISDHQSIMLKKMETNIKPGCKDLNLGEALQLILYAEGFMSHLANAMIYSANTENILQRHL